MKTKIKILAAVALTAIVVGMLNGCSSSAAEDSMQRKIEAPVSNVINLQNFGSWRNSIIFS